VTVSLAVVRRFGWGEVAPYVLAQLAGAVVAGLLILAVFGTAAADLGTGQTSLAGGTSFLRGVVGEAIGTFLLVTAIMALAVDKRAPGGWAGLVIGLSVTCAILLLGNVTGGSLNPARSFGPLVATSLGGGGRCLERLPRLRHRPAHRRCARGGHLRPGRATARPRDAEDEDEAQQGTAGDITGRREERS
jgi:glycerol uptake facilitator-like aquaporin